MGFLTNEGYYYNFYISVQITAHARDFYLKMNHAREILKSQLTRELNLHTFRDDHSPDTPDSAEKAAALNRVLQRQGSNLGLNRIMTEYERKYGAVDAQTVYTPEQDRASFAKHLQNLSAALEVIA